MTKGWGFSTFLQIRLKNEGFPTFIQIGSLELSDFWSLDQLVVETLGVASVRSSVHTPAHTSVRNSFSLKLLITFF